MMWKTADPTVGKKTITNALKPEGRTPKVTTEETALLGCIKAPSWMNEREVWWK